MMLPLIRGVVSHKFCLVPCRYEITPEGKRATKLDQILLNGNNIALLVPGGDPEAVSGGAAAEQAAE